MKTTKENSKAKNINRLIPQLLISCCGLAAILCGCTTNSDGLANTDGQTHARVVANVTHDGEYPASKMVKILPGDQNNGAYQSEITLPSASQFPSGTSTFVLYVEFPSGANAGMDTISYCLYRDGSQLSEPVVIADKSYEGKPSTIWSIRQGDDTVHLKSRSLFHNTTPNQEFASTPHTAAIVQGVQGVCLRTVVKSGTSAFAAGSYRIDILWDKTVMRSLSFDVQ